MRIANEVPPVAFKLGIQFCIGEALQSSVVTQTALSRELLSLKYVFWMEMLWISVGSTTRVI